MYSLLKEAGVRKAFNGGISSWLATMMSDWPSKRYCVSLVPHLQAPEPLFPEQPCGHVLSALATHVGNHWGVGEWGGQGGGGTGRGAQRGLRWG